MSEKIGGGFYFGVCFKLGMVGNTELVSFAD